MDIQVYEKSSNEDCFTILAASCSSEMDQVHLLMHLTALSKPEKNGGKGFIIKIILLKEMKVNSTF